MSGPRRSSIGRGRNHFVLVALAGEQPAGVIELRDNDHVSLLFVDSRFQRHRPCGVSCSCARCRLPVPRSRVSTA